MPEWDQVPELIVPMGTGGYIGWGLLGLLGLALLIAAAMLYEQFGPFALIVAVGGTIPLGIAAFHYFRTVEMGWRWPNLAVWGGLIALALLGAYIAHVMKERAGIYAPGSSLITLGGVAVGTVLAAGLDAWNERLANWPISPQGFFGLILGGAIVAGLLISWMRNN